MGGRLEGGREGGWREGKRQGGIFSEVGGESKGRMSESSGEQKRDKYENIESESDRGMVEGGREGGGGGEIRRQGDLAAGSDAYGHSARHYC